MEYSELAGKQEHIQTYKLKFGLAFFFVTVTCAL